MLSSTAEYALRALIVLASLPAGQPVLGAELARQTQVPPNYLSKILHVLRKAGLVTATRGTGGGYLLGRDPRRVRLADVVEVIDGGGVRKGCLLGKELSCTDENPCSIHERWQEVRQAVTDFMESTTLFDVAAAPEVLGLGGPFAPARSRGARGAARAGRAPKGRGRADSKRG